MEKTRRDGAEHFVVGFGVFFGGVGLGTGTRAPMLF